MRFYEKINGKLKPEDAEEIVNVITVSNRLEGMDMPAEEREMLLKFAKGEITEAEYDAWARSYTGAKS